MWWSKKKENDEDKATRIIKESLSQPGVTVEHLTDRLSKECGIEKVAAKSIAKQVIDDFVALSYDKKVEIIKAELSDVYELPFSQANLDLVQKEIDSFGKNQIDSDQLFDSIFDIRQLESEDWLTKGEKLLRENKQHEALHSYDISLKFNPYNLNTLEERGKLLQDLNFHRDAIKDFSKIIEDNVNDFSAIYLRGCSYLRLCDFKNALADIEKAIELSKLANDQQRQIAKDNGFDSIASMYRGSLNLLDILKNSPDQVVNGMRDKNGNERGE